MKIKDYETGRNSLIVKAEDFANKSTDGNRDHKDWDRIFIKEMDRLSFAEGLQGQRFHGVTTKSIEFIRAFADQTNKTQTETAATLKYLVGLIKSELDKEGVCRVPGLGTFRYANVPVKIGSHPQSQTPMTIPGYRAVRFTSSKKFKA